MKHIIKPALSLFLIASITTGLLAMVYNLTLEPREAQQRRTRERMINELIPMGDSFAELDLNTAGSITGIYEVTGASGLIGYAVELSVPGYSGDIEIMAGFLTRENRFAGIRILSHSETPGLGAFAARESFYGIFTGKEILPFEVTKNVSAGHEIQAISGATITTRAVISAVNEAVEWYISRNVRHGSGGLNR